jgi:hypothetical protein
MRPVFIVTFGRLFRYDLVCFEEETIARDILARVSSRLRAINHLHQLEVVASLSKLNGIADCQLRNPCSNVHLLPVGHLSNFETTFVVEALLDKLANGPIWFGAHLQHCRICLAWQHLRQVSILFHNQPASFSCHISDTISFILSQGLR